jgi:hypothetical protein
MKAEALKAKLIELFDVSTTFSLGLMQIKISFLQQFTGVVVSDERVLKELGDRRGSEWDMGVAALGELLEHLVKKEHRLVDELSFDESLLPKVTASYLVTLTGEKSSPKLLSEESL